MLRLYVLIKKESSYVKAENVTNHPYISIIIAAYNEEKVIAEKIENCLNFDYPENKIEINVFSDGSTDKTEEIVKAYAKENVKLFSIPGRLGKTQCQNIVCQEAKGDIVIFTDANSLCKQNSMLEMARLFEDKSIGCVCGKLVYEKNIQNTGSSFFERLFIHYLQSTKRLESLALAPVGANGSLYAVRKDLFEPISHLCLEDLLRPIKILQKGYRVVYEPNIVCSEPTVDGLKQIWQKKRRIASRSMATLLREREILNPLKYGFFSVQVWSKSVLRRIGLIVLFLLLLINSVLIYAGCEDQFFLVFLSVQVLFWVWAIISAFLLVLCEYTGFVKNKFLNFFLFPGYFLLINLAALSGYFTYLITKKAVINWEKPV